MAKVGITERGDAGLDLSWLDKLNAGKVDAVIAITKNPGNIPECLPNNVIVHCTITGLGTTEWEPRCLIPSRALRYYNWLVNEYGGDRIVLRIDPIIPYDPWLSKAFEVLSHRRGRVRVSFIDMYQHVRKRFLDAYGYEFDKWEGLHSPLEMRIKIINEMKKTGDIEVCGEPGISCTGCVSVKDMEVFGIESSGNLKRQREYCPCLSEKVELLSNKHPCANKCLYCYWKD
jgi:hypothetical protein